MPAHESRAGDLRTADGPHSALRRTAWPARVSVALAAVLSLAMFFRELIGSGFDLIPGGLSDARFLIAILEHWRTVLLRGAPMASPPFFAPEVGVLGYSESMVLFAPPYIAWRALGLDRYLAFTATLVIVKAASPHAAAKRRGEIEVLVVHHLDRIGKDADTSFTIRID